MHITTNKYSNASTPKWQWRSSSDPFRMAPLGIAMPTEPPAARCRCPVGCVRRCVAPWWLWGRRRWQWRWRQWQQRGCTRLTTLAPAQPPKSSPALGLHCGANGSASLAGLIKSLEEGGGAWSAAANAPVSPVSPSPLGLAGQVVNANTMWGKLSPRALTHGRGGALPAVGTALAMAKGTAGAGSAGGAEKPLLQHPERWSARRIAREGAGAKCRRKAKPGIELRHCRERASKRLMSRKKSDRVRVTRELRTDLSGHGMKATSQGARGGDRRGKDLSRHRK